MNTPVQRPSAAAGRVSSASVPPTTNVDLRAASTQPVGAPAAPADARAPTVLVADAGHPPTQVALSTTVIRPPAVTQSAAAPAAQATAVAPAVVDADAGHPSHQGSLSTTVNVRSPETQAAAAPAAQTTAVADPGHYSHQVALSTTVNGPPAVRQPAAAPAAQATAVAPTVIVADAGHPSHQGSLSTTVNVRSPETQLAEAPAVPATAVAPTAVMANTGHRSHQGALSTTVNARAAAPRQAQTRPLTLSSVTGLQRSYRRTVRQLQWGRPGNSLLVNLQISPAASSGSQSPSVGAHGHAVTTPAGRVPPPPPPSAPSDETGSASDAPEGNSAGLGGATGPSPPTIVRASAPPTTSATERTRRQPVPAPSDSSAVAVVVAPRSDSATIRSADAEPTSRQSEGRDAVSTNSGVYSPDIHLPTPADDRAPRIDSHSTTTMVVPSVAELAAVPLRAGAGAGGTSGPEEAPGGHPLGPEQEVESSADVGSGDGLGQSGPTEPSGPTVSLAATGSGIALVSSGDSPSPVHLAPAATPPGVPAMNAGHESADSSRVVATPISPTTPTQPLTDVASSQPVMDGLPLAPPLVVMSGGSSRNTDASLPTRIGGAPNEEAASDAGPAQAAAVVPLTPSAPHIDVTVPSAPMLTTEVDLAAVSVPRDSTRDDAGVPRDPGVAPALELGESPPANRDAEPVVPLALSTASQGVDTRPVVDTAAMLVPVPLAGADGRGSVEDNGALAVNPASPQSELSFRGEALVQLRRRLGEFEDMRLRLVADSAANLAIQPPAVNVCPPSGIRVKDSGSGVERAVSVSTKQIASGSSTRIFEASMDHTSLLHRVVVKVLYNLESLTLRDGLAREMAFGWMMRQDESGLVPKFYDIVPTPGGISDHCRVRTLVSELAGQATLSSRSVNRFQAAAVIAQTLAIIKKVHALGFIHGDVHGQNFVYSRHDAAAADESVRIIDFGRAEPFVDASGQHLSEEVPQLYYSHGFSASFLSPWELEGIKRKTRRDDVFRIAELALKLAGLHAEFMARVDALETQARGEVAPGASINKHLPHRSRMRELKIIRLTLPCPQMVPIFRDFYQYALSLNFDEAPEFDHWIRAFTHFAQNPRIYYLNDDNILN